MFVTYCNKSCVSFSNYRTIFQI